MAIGITRGVRKIALPGLAFVLALFVSGLLIAFSDPKVLHLSHSPLKFLGCWIKFGRRCLFGSISGCDL